HVFYPRLSQAFTTDRETYRARFRRLVMRLALVGVVLGAVLSLIGPLVIHLLFPRAFAGAAVVVRWLGLAMLLRALSTAYGTGLHAGNGEHARARNNLVALLA